VATTHTSSLRFLCFRIRDHILDIAEQFFRVVEDPVLHHVLDAARALHLSGRIVETDPSCAVQHFQIRDRIRVDEHEIGEHSRTHCPDFRFQDYPTTYNYNDEQNRFGEAGRLWKQAASPGSEKWNAVIDELIKLHFNIDPTLTIREIRSVGYHEVSRLIAQRCPRMGPLTS
jgi:hypothetical protein